MPGPLMALHAAWMTPSGRDPARFPKVRKTMGCRWWRGPSEVSQTIHRWRNRITIIRNIKSKMTSWFIPTGSRLDFHSFRSKKKKRWPFRPVLELSHHTKKKPILRHHLSHFPLPLPFSLPALLVSVRSRGNYCLPEVQRESLALENTTTGSNLQNTFLHIISFYCEKVRQACSGSKCLIWHFNVHWE